MRILNHSHQEAKWHEVQDIADRLNKDIARILGVEPKPVNVDFVPLIERKAKFVNGEVIYSEVAGRCFIEESRIQIALQRNWGITLIEELIHLYKPSLGHPQVRQTVKQCVLYLKAKQEEMQNASIANPDRET